MDLELFPRIVPPSRGPMPQCRARHSSFGRSGQIAPQGSLSLRALRGQSHRAGGRLRVPDNITLVQLPSYSPELNPDEMANADLKQGVTKLAPARTKLQLVKATAKHLRSVQRQPERIRKYFEHEPVRYAA